MNIRRSMIVLGIILVVVLGIVFVMQLKSPVVEKPVIYLYPEQPTHVTVDLAVNGTVTSTWPKSDGRWQVNAHPDGKLTTSDGRSYDYLFWEGRLSTEFPQNEGFVVPGKQSGEFLEEKLTILGLNASERNDFITYWMPRMQANSWNLITFQTTAYTETARLDITPHPDTVIRVYLTYRPLSKPISVPEQRLAPTQRKGFTVVEWGGNEAR